MPQNIVSGIAGLGSTLVRDNKLTHTDALLPTSPLTSTYTLCWTLAALYANASIALNSVAGDDVDLFACTAAFKPTVIVTSPGTMQKYLTSYTRSGLGPSRFARYFQRQSLKKGIMPTKKPIPDLSGQDAMNLILEQQALMKLRLFLIGQPANSKTKLDSKTLDELRVDLGTRVGYALTAGKVAGAVAQTNIADYRDKKGVVCVGPPLGSVEVHLKGDEEKMGTPTPSGTVRCHSTLCDNFTDRNLGGCKRTRRHWWCGRAGYACSDRH